MFQKMTRLISLITGTILIFDTVTHETGQSWKKDNQKKMMNEYIAPEMDRVQQFFDSNKKRNFKFSINSVEDMKVKFKRYTYRSAEVYCILYQNCFVNISESNKTKR